MKSLLPLGMVLLCALPLAAAERSVPLRNPEPQVLVQYEALQWADRAEMRELFVDMSPKMRADVWTVHLMRILREHPELTPEQRSLVFEGLGLIASGIFELDRQSPEWITQGREPMLNLSKRVFALFPPELARSIMNDPRGAATAAPGPVDRMNRFRPAVQWGDCVCNISYQWDCSWSRCVESWPSCFPYYTCGPWMSDTCDGVCG